MTNARRLKAVAGSATVLGARVVELEQACEQREQALDRAIQTNDGLVAENHNLKQKLVKWQLENRNLRAALVAVLATHGPVTDGGTCKGYVHIVQTIARKALGMEGKP